MTDSNVSLALRLPAALHRGLSDMAKAEQRSLNGQIVYLLTKVISEQKKG